MKYLITGGAGFIGSTIAHKLIEKKHKIVVVDNLLSGKKENISKAVKFYKVDILDKELSEIFKKERPEIVFHFASHIEARESIKNPIFDAKNNILGSINVLENCKNVKVKKIIFASSGGEIYGDAEKIPTPETCSPNPISPYGVAKLAIEKYLFAYAKMYGIKFVALRFGNVYGPKQNPYGEAGVIAIFTNKLLCDHQPVIHGDGNQTKDYIFIDDAVEAAIKFSESKFSGVVNIATGVETSVNQIFNKLKKIIGSKSSERHVDFPLCGFKRGCLSIKKAQKIIKWKPVHKIDDGLLMTVNWFKKNS